MSRLACGRCNKSGRDNVELLMHGELWEPAHLLWTARRIAGHRRGNTCHQQVTIGRLAPNSVKLYKLMGGTIS